MYQPSSTARAVSAFVMALLVAACGGKSEQETLSSAKEKLASRQYAAATVELKATLQQSPQSLEARFLLGTALLEQGQAAAAQVELAKALEGGYDVEHVVPKIARAWLATGRTKELIQSYGSTELKLPRAQAELLTAIATAHAQQGQGKEAEAVIERALAADPKFAWAIRTKAQVLVAQKKETEALALLDQAAALEPADGYAPLLKGLILRYLRGDLSGAKAAFERSAADPQTVTQARTALVQLALKEKNLEEARRQAAELKKSRPHHGQTIYVTALVAFASKDYLTAESTIDQLMQKVPNNPNLLLLGGAASLHRGKLLEAEAKLGKVVHSVEQAPAARKLLAETYLRQGQPEQAVGVLSPLIEQSSSDGDARSLMGQALLQMGRVNDAVEHLQVATKLKPADTEVRTALAMADLVRGRENEAFGALQELSAADPGETADLALIGARMRRNELDQALVAIDALERKQPSSATPRYLRAVALRGKGDATGERAALESTLKLNPGHVSAVLALASLDVRAKKLDAARVRLDELVKSRPGSSAAQMARLDVMAIQGAKAPELLEAIDTAIRASPQDPAPRVARIEFLRKTGDVKGAALAAQSAMASLPDNPRVLAAAGLALADAGDNQQAISALNRLASLTPKSPDPLLRIADVHSKLGDRAAASASLSRAFEISPISPDVQKRLLRDAQANRDFSRALAAAKDLQKRQPQSASGYLFEGDIQAAKKAWKAASDAYRLAMGKSDAHGRPQIRLHMAVWASGDKSGADGFASQWLKANPKDLRFLEYLGSLALNQGDKVRAESRFRDILALSAKHAVALNNVAWLMADRGAPGAVDMAERAVAAAQGSPLVLDTLAKAQASEGNWTKAIETQRRALDGTAGRPDFRLSLARYLVKAGDRAQARTELQALKALGAKFPQQTEVAGLLASIGN